MPLNLNHAVGIIKNLFKELHGTNVMSLRIKNIHEAEEEGSYIIDLTLKLVSTNEEYEYVVTYNSRGGSVENLRELDEDEE